MMTDSETNTPICAACGEPGRLHCAGCGRTFCVDHVERHFAMGYFYFCAECLAQRAEPPKHKRFRKGAPKET
jgi:hypothetical protein